MEPILASGMAVVTITISKEIAFRRNQGIEELAIWEDSKDVTNSLLVYNLMC